jgi:hypothetical protein
MAALAGAQEAIDNASGYLACWRRAMRSRLLSCWRCVLPMLMAVAFWRLAQAHLHICWLIANSE